MVRWLLQNRIERCPANRNVFDWVADHGHLDVIKVLHEARIEGCSARAMNWAAKNGHLETLIWLHENRAEVSRAGLRLSTADCLRGKFTIHL